MERNSARTEMRLTSFSDYALRLLILCASKEGNLVTIAEAADTYAISKSHLMKIANELVRVGFLQSVRGRNGGLRLARPASDINIGKVVRHMERESVLVECFSPETNACVITRACGLKFLLAGAMEDFYKRLETASLADIMRKPKAMQRLLGLTK
jgi:Rrf2 family transcriptional regulator, nitric oxide-sensitive transcriptional repressor